MSSKYVGFAELMDRFKYKWEAFPVTTEDDYELTMFRIVGKNGYEWYKPSRPKYPVLVMHNAFTDGTSWFDIKSLEYGNSKNAPLPSALFDAGFDVFVGNPRGTEYSNPNLDRSSAYWDFTLEDYNKDLKAFIAGIKTATGD